MENQKESSSEKYFINGHVITKRSIGVSSLLIRAYDQNLKREVLLGSAESGEKGAFQISFTAKSLKGKTQPDIILKAFKNKQSKQVIASSPLRCNAKQEETFILVIPEEAVEQAPEFEQITDALLPYLGKKLTFKDLQENQERKDLTYLAMKSGWDARLIAMRSLAAQYSQQAQVPEELFYALFRAGKPTDADRLYLTPAKVVGQIWETAAAQNIISSAHIADISEHLEAFKQGSTHHALKEAKPIGISNWKDMLDLSLKKEEEKERFLALYHNRGKDKAAFWEEVRTEFGKEASNKLQLDGKLGYLTGNNAPLINKLFTEGKVENSPLDLIRNGFYKLVSWEAILTDDIEIPEVIPGTSKAEKKRNYAQHLASQLKSSYPTAVIAEMVNHEELLFQEAAAVKETVYQFFLDQQGDFEIDRQPIEQYLKDNELRFHEEEEVHQKALQQTKRLQRLYQCTPTDQALKALWDQGFDSARSIVQYNEKGFIAQFGVSLGGEDLARLTYAKAHQIHSMVLNVANSYLIHRLNPKIYGVSATLQQDDGNGQVLVPTPAELPDAYQNFAERSLKSPAGADLIAYASLEQLFGAMDYCACEHCRSVLSPAAYLVDLLQFINCHKQNSDGIELPCDIEKENPLEVLLGRRPDIEHIQLSCNNTNTVFPYIDLVNEILEHFIVNGHLHQLKNNIEDDISTEELLANPQYVEEGAYAILQEQTYPLTLPFNHSLEVARLYYQQLQLPLYEGMEILRENDSLDNESSYGWRDIHSEYLNISKQEYSILTAMVDDEGRTQIGNLPQYFGEDESLSYIAFNAKLSYASLFAEKTEISYKELTAILKTQFINPDSQLIPKLEQLFIDFETIRKIGLEDMTDEELSLFREHIDSLDLDLSIYGGSMEEWIKRNHEAIMGLIVLANQFLPQLDQMGVNTTIIREAFGPQDNFDAEKFKALIPNDFNEKRVGGDIDAWIKEHYQDLLKFSRPGSSDECSFTELGLRYAMPDFAQNAILPWEYIKLLRFIRLWKKLGWSIEETDKVLAALYHVDYQPQKSDSPRRAMEKLNMGFKDLLIKLAHLQRVLEKLKLDRSRELSKILAFWSDIETVGNPSLYAQLFLNPGTTRPDSVFEEDGYGNYLQDPAQKLQEHQLAIQAAFNLTSAEWDLIFKELAFAEDEVLSLPNLSAIFRYGHLARKLKISVQELLILKKLSGIDPFHELEALNPSILRFIELVHLIKSSGFKLVKLNYYLQHEDLSRKSSPKEEDILTLIRTLRTSLTAIEREHEGIGRPGAELVQDNMTVVYGPESAKLFISLLHDTASFSVNYDHSSASLESEIMRISDRISYNDFQKKLSFAGVMTERQARDLKVAADDSATFASAIDELYQVSNALFEKHAALKPLFRADFTSLRPAEQELHYQSILESLLTVVVPQLKKRELAQQLSAVWSVDLDLLNMMLTNTNVLTAENNSDELIKDLLATETTGMSIQDVDDAIHLQFYLEAPQNGHFILDIESNASAVELSLNGENTIVSLSPSSNIWSSDEPISLKAGVLYRAEIKATGTTESPTLKWATEQRGKEQIPSQFLYPAEIVETFSNSYLRLLKVMTLIEDLEFNIEELVHFGQLEGEVNWLNAIAAPDNPTSATLEQVFDHFIQLLHYQQLKTALKIGGADLIAILKNPAATDAEENHLLYALTPLKEANVNELLSRFSFSIEDLSNIENFRKLQVAHEFIEKTALSAELLVAVTGHLPSPATVQKLQAALRSKYDEQAWLKIQQSISDQLRIKQRDALIAYVLHSFSRDPETKHINSTDRLFEHFLIDVEMDACMKTSRIKQAISSVQLFIQRCLINLEQNVSAASINARQWEWMKRYRVWEANRKIFLYPENWLDPELRKTKSSFFRDFESELLQSDITEEKAHTALLHYLEKLDDVAKLEICGMYLQENDSAETTDDVLHVFARTPGANRKYYYRRREHDQFWTPWEKVELDIEDNPILPVVWKERLFLFWLNIIQKGPENAQANIQRSGSGTLAEATLSTEPLNNQIKVEVNLSWSEYYNGKWQPRRTSDFEKPIRYTYEGQSAFQRVNLRLSSLISSKGSLYIIFQDTENDLNYRKFFNRRRFFKLFNKSSSPMNQENEILLEDENKFVVPRDADGRLIYTTRENTLHVEYLDDYLILEGLKERHQLLSNSKGLKVVEPLHYIKPATTAFFCQDRRHTFFVQPRKGAASIDEYIDFYSTPVVAEFSSNIPALWTRAEDFGVKIDLVHDSLVKDPLDPEAKTLGVRPIEEQFVSSPITIGIQDTRTIQFGERAISAFGGVDSPGS